MLYQGFAEQVDEISPHFILSTRLRKELKGSMCIGEPDNRLCKCWFEVNIRLEGAISTALVLRIYHIVVQVQSFFIDTYISS